MRQQALSNMDNIPPSARLSDDVLTVEALEAFLIASLVMGSVSLPNLEDYWRTTSCNQWFIGGSGVPHIISRDLYCNIQRCLHFYTKEEREQLEAGGAAFIEKPVAEILKRCFVIWQENYSLGNAAALDEFTIKFKGRSQMKQYNPMKPIKRGFKVFAVCCPATGYVWNAKLYLGKATWEFDGGQEVKADLGAGQYLSRELLKRVVLTQHEPSRRGQQGGMTIVADRWFTGIKMAELLSDQGIHVIGTIMANRLPPAISAIVNAKRGSHYFGLLGKMEPGQHVAFAKVYPNDENQLEKAKPTYIISMDTKIFCCVSTHPAFSAKKYEILSLARRDKKGHRQMRRRHVIVDFYNKLMAGCDLAGQIQRTYTVDRKSTR
jgi:hypothetical protein